jgi:hypothetical protein
LNVCRPPVAFSEGFAVAESRETDRSIRCNGRRPHSSTAPKAIALCSTRQTATRSQGNHDPSRGPRPSAADSRAGASDAVVGPGPSVGPRPRGPRGGGRGASHHAPSSPAPPNRRDSDTPMVPLLFDMLFPIIHVAHFGLDVSRPAADTTIQQHRPPRAGAHNPSGSLIP